MKVAKMLAMNGDYLTNNSTGVDYDTTKCKYIEIVVFICFITGLPRNVKNGHLHVCLNSRVFKSISMNTLSLPPQFVKMTEPCTKLRLWLVVKIKRKLRKKSCHCLMFSTTTAFE